MIVKLVRTERRATRTTLYIYKTLIQCMKDSNMESPSVAQFKKPERNMEIPSPAQSRKRERRKKSVIPFLKKPKKPVGMPEEQFEGRVILRQELLKHSLHFKCCNLLLAQSQTFGLESSLQHRTRY